MKVIPLLLVVFFSCLSACTSSFNLYAINPFSIAKTTAGHSGAQPFGLRTLIPQDIHQGPILILAPEFEEQPDTRFLHAFLVPHGMRSLSNNSKFGSLYNSFLQFKLSGLVLYPGSFANITLAKSRIIDITTPDSLQATELLQFIGNPAIPVVYIAPTEIFDGDYFLPLNRFAVFSFTEVNIDLSETYGPFYYPIDQGNVGPEPVQFLCQETQEQIPNKPSLEIVSPKNISETEDKL